MGHSKRSPSASARWLACSASVSAIDADIEAGIIVVKEDDGGGVHAIWGTRCHLIGEMLLLRRPINEIREVVPQINEDPELLETATEYADYVFGLMREGSKLFVEKRVSLAKWIPSDKDEDEETGGTADAIIIHKDGSMEVVDLKGGKGIAVDVVGNTQLQLYAAGAVADFDMVYDIDKVRYHVVQPRLGIFQYEETTAKALMEFMSYVEHRVTTNEFVAGEKQCQWCPRSGYCEAQKELLRGGVFKSDDLDFSQDLVVSDPKTLSLQQLVKIKQNAPQITKLLKAVDERLMERLTAGADIKEFKLVAGRSNRMYDPSVSQDDLVDFMVEELELDEDKLITEKLATITEVEKLLDAEGKKKLSKFIIKPDGKPTIAPMADKRPALQSLDDDVAFLNEEE